MLRRVLGFAGALLTVLYAANCYAQFGGGFSGVQTRILERSISRNLDRIFKPKLIISKGATGPVTAVGLSDDEHYLVSAVGDNTVRVWDLWVGRELARLPAHGDRITAVAVGHRGNFFATASQDRTVKIWSLRRLGPPVTLGAPNAEITSLTFLGDDSRLATVGVDGGVKVWSLSDKRVLSDFQAHGAGRAVIAAPPDGTRIVSAGADGFVRVWNSASGERMAEIGSGGAATALSLNREDGRIAAALLDGSIVLLQADGARIGQLVGHDGKVSSVAFVPKTGRLLSGGIDGTVRLWDAQAPGREPRVFGRHDGPVTGVEVSHDGAFAMSVSEDGTTRLWNVATGAQLLTLISTTSGWAVIDAKGRYDGNEPALSGIDWRSDDAVANIDDFAETHYQSALLPRTLKDGEAIADAKTIVDGVAYPPKIRIVSETGRAETKSVVVEITAEDNGGGGVSEIRLYRNGKLVRASAGQMRRDDPKRLVGRYELDVESGQTVVSATAINNERLESRPETITVASGRPQRRGKIHLLTVGINKYRDRSLDLFYAKPDAQSIDGYFAAGKAALPVAAQVALRDGQATRDNILAAIRTFRDVPQEDMVVVYLAGHGVSAGDQWYFISHDAQLSGDVQDGAIGVLSSSEIKAEVEALNADRILLLIDTCHSGSLVEPIKDYRGMKALRLLARTVGTHVLAATDRTQSAIELQKLGHGIFTYALLDGLKGNADYIGNGVVSATGLVRYVEEAVPLLAKQYAEDDQYPTGLSRGIDFPVSVAEQSRVLTGR
jgi:WD40 repeat protein